MEEMLDDTLEGLDEDSELEDEAEAEVDQVLYEITDGKLGVAGAGKELPVRSKPFPALHCFILTRIPESQRPRGGSGERSGDGTDASSAEQSAQWIIEALRARCTRIFTSPSRLFMFLLHLSRVPAGCFILFILSKTFANTFVHRPTGNAAHSLVRLCCQERASSSGAFVHTSVLR